MKRLLISILAVGLSAALIYGATMAWFTDTADVTATTFKAGTVKIDTNQSEGFVNGSFNMDIVNPGDSFSGSWIFDNNGSKKIQLRVIPTFALTGDTQPVPGDKWLFLASSLFKFNEETGHWEDKNLEDKWLVEEGLVEGIENQVGVILYYDGVVDGFSNCTMDMTLTFNGASMNNYYQGCQLVVGGVVQAVQNSHQGTGEGQWEWADFATFPANAAANG